MNLFMLFKAAKQIEGLPKNYYSIVLHFVCILVIMGFQKFGQHPWAAESTKRVSNAEKGSQITNKVSNIE